MSSDREFQRQNLEQAVQNAESVVEEQRVTEQQEKQEAEELEQALREAEFVAERQKEAEEQGKEAERKISEVAGV